MIEETDRYQGTVNKSICAKDELCNIQEGGTTFTQEQKSGDQDFQNLKGKLEAGKKGRLSCDV